MKSVKPIIAIAFLLNAPVFCAEAPHELTLGEALLRAEAASPDLKAAQARETQGQEAIRILQSVYYPSVDFQAVDSWGYPGSNGALGISGLISSPYRIGPGAELVSKLSILDPTRLYGVRTARYNLAVLQERTQITRFQVDQSALQIYFDAARNRGQMEAWQRVQQDIDKVTQEVDRFVKTGQHSPVERYLVDDQSEEAAMNLEASQEKYQIALKRLALLISMDEKTIACPASTALNESALSAIQSRAPSPLIARALAESRAAHAGINERSAQHYPKVVALASVGDVSKSRLVDKNDYTGGVAFLLPIFEGGEIAGDVERAKALAAEKDQDLASTQLELDELNARLDEAIASARIKLKHLDLEEETGQKALRLARQRYLDFIGPLIEVRESIRNLARIEIQRSEVQADLLSALAEKALLNGGRIA